jgi:long-chain acyl-CoA synthetase
MTDNSPARSGRAANLGYFFDAALARLPGKVAIIDLFGGVERTRTYRQLDARMDQVAGMLLRLGVRPGERVGMLVGNRLEFIEFFFGAMRAGAIPVLLNTRLAADMLVTLFDDAACSLALIDPGCNREALAIAARVKLPCCLLLESSEAVAAAQTNSDNAGEPSHPAGFLNFEAELKMPTAPVPLPRIEHDTQAFQPYTSGSTGRPKGAIMTHRGMLWYIDHNQRHWPAAEDDRGMIAMPLFHKNALRGTVKPMLHAGGSFVLMPAYEPKAYMQALANYRCTYSRGVAAVFTMFLQHRDFIDTLDLSALRSMSIGSAVVAPELLDAVERALPGVKTSESYGTTEGGSPLRAPLDGRAVPRGSVGVVAPDIEVELLDADGNPHPSLGELVTRSPYVCLGYHNQPEVSAQKLKEGWLRSGDIFYRDPQGFFFFRSRVDDMFSCGGENVYPKEVENLLFTHPDVVNAVVVALPHSVKGTVPGALIIVRAGAQVTAAGLKAFCLEKGPAYAHPRYIELTSALPLNGAGKIDRNLAQAQLLAGYQAAS